MVGERVRLPGIVLDEELGRGAFSVVYRGRRGGRPCAVKLGRADDRSARWFRREAAALARVNDPGLPAVIEVGRGGGRPYLVMELVEGETLASRLSRTALSERETIDIALQLCRALDAVHRRGLVHRDVKPKNIVLDPSGRVCLVDFGFAAVAHAAHEMAGTRAYAAPEQLRSPTIVDNRTDLYALGRVLYECLTGDRRGASDLHPEAEIASPLAGVIASLIAIDPDARYRSAAALRDDLERVQRGEPPRGPATDAAEPETLAFVGRVSELRRILELFADGERGRGHALIVHGQAGSGKSRLVRETARALTPRATVIQVRCEKDDPRPIAALRATVDAIVATVAPRNAPALVRAAGGLGPVATAISPALGALVGAPAPLAMDAEAFTQLATELLALIVRELGPTLIAVDDAQWLDHTSADVFTGLALRARQLPLLVVIAGRSQPDRLDALGRQATAGLQAVLMEPFGHTDTAALASAYLGAEATRELTEWLTRVADGTPLGTIEVLEAMLDAGALEPRDGTWHFERAIAERMHLPRGTSALLDRRLRELPEATRRVCEAAAVIGRSFGHRLLASVVGVDEEDLGFALAHVRRAGLLEAAPNGTSRFVHDSVREALLEKLDPPARRKHHQRIAEVLDEAGVDPYLVATHYAAGETDRRPDRLIEVCHAAAAHALAAFDNEAALRFFDSARMTAARHHRELPPALLIDAAEAELRLGAYEESIAHFEAALAVTREPRSRAHLLSRITWGHQGRPDPEAAWRSLSQAFAELGERMPVEDARTTADTALAWLMSRVAARRAPADRRNRAEMDLLCELYYQNVRLSMDYGKPVRMVTSMLQAHTIAQRLGPGPTLARMEALYAAVASMLGARRAGDEHMAAARRMAAEGAHPTILAYCFQLGALTSCFAGEFEPALSQLRTLFDEHGHWLELNEYCLNAFNAYLIEALRGRPAEAWSWLERAIERVARHGRAPSAFVPIAHAARATWRMIHRDAGEAALRRALRVPVDFDAPLTGTARLATWGARARSFVERGELGAELEALMREHAQEGIDPRKAHPVMAEYYVAVVHARIHQALRATPAERTLAAGRLAGATANLRAAARSRLLKSHVRVAEGVHAWITGSAKEAAAKLAEAEEIADRESCTWARFQTERVRAHVLREEGRAEAARERARAAAHIARDNGAVHWARWIHDELGVSVAHGATRHAHDGLTASVSSSRRQLEGLLGVLRAGAQQLELDEQARVLAEELRESASADRVFMAFHAEGPRGSVHAVGLARGDEPWEGGSRVQHAIDRAMDNGLLVTSSIEPRTTGADPDSNDIRAVTLPLWLRERPVGAVHLERDSGRPPFSSDDIEILVALSYQVPVALELARAMRERIRLEDALRQAQKMEAVGRLVGGIAHDFNNMMMVVISSVTLLLQKDDLSPDVREELHVLESAIERAVDLTRQLLAFARRQPRRAEPHDASDVLAGLAPMLRRLVPQHIDVRTELWPEALRVHVDRGFFEQALVNLCVNARDAMPDGGTLTLRTSRAVLDEEDVRLRPGLLPGPHVRITVEDTGVGMPREVRENAFDPFFTTKERGQGTGLGLSMVHGFVDQSEGAIEIESEPGRGTLFRIHLPLLPPAEVAVEAGPPAPRAPEPELRAPEPERRAPVPEPPRPARNTILIVEDEPRIRDVLERVLSDEGYDVLTSGLPEHALALIDAPRAAIDLLITDVLMPGLSGVELARAIRARTPSVKLLYMSGYAGPEIRDLASLDPAAFIEKPFRTEAFLTKVRDLLAE